MMYDYVVLLAGKDNGKVVRMREEEWEIFKDGKWIQTGIMILYFNDSDPLYDQYKEISEKEALEMIKAS